MGFLYPGFLYTFGLLAIPVIIHLFNFRKYKVVFFSNTKLLIDIKQQTKAKSRLKHILILISRLLFLTALILAFSRPFLPVKDNEIAEKTRLVSIYIDNSFSMDGENEQGKLIEVAKNLAFGISDAYGAKTKFLLITNDFDKKHQHFVSKEKLTDLISSIQTSPKLTKLKDVIQRQKDFFAEYQSDFSNAFYIISDFQKNTANIKECEIDSSSSYFLLPLNPQKTPNLFVDSCWFDSPGRVYNQTENLNIRITNNSEEDLFRIPVNVYINDSLKAMTSVDANAGSSAIVTLNFNNTAKGLVYGRIELNDYPITYDNNFYFSYKIEETLQIMAMNGNDNKYLSTLFAGDEYFKLTNSSLQEINYFEFKENNTVIFNQIDEISSGMINEIKDFVSNGGSFVLIPSEKANIESYNNLMGVFGSPFFTKPDTQKIEIKTINTNALLFKNVFKKIDEKIKMPALYKYYPLQSSARTLTEILLSDENNKPVLSVTPYNKGKVYVFNFPLNEKCSDFITHPLFVPVFYNIGFNSIGNYQEYFTIGDNKGISLHKAASDNRKNSLHIRQKDGDLDFVPGLGNSAGEQTVYLYDNIREAGHYIIYEGEKQIQPLSANYNRLESNLVFHTTVDLQEITESLNLTNVSIYSGDSENITADIENMEKGIELWKYFLIAAIFFLGLEIAIIRFIKT
ncbi:MAG: BatA domain-containing protein [Bacteroidales bacterium]|nr:BatA domain-containing protein [Bacteroidales bacterium]